MFNKINLQLFNDNIDTVAGLDSLLGGNTTSTQPEETQPKDKDTAVVQDADTNEPQDTGSGTPGDTGGGGDQSLESSTEPKDEGRQRASHNAAMAKMRIENAQYSKALQQLAQALGIQESDPNKLGDMLVNMAQEKLAKDANVPVELYKELNQTKEELAAVKYHQNQSMARDKFMAVKEQYGLTDKELISFAEQLDKEGVNAIENPKVDLEYEYYKRNREAIEKKRIAQAVEEALRNSQAADVQSTTPSSQQGAPQEQNDKKINNVSALNDLLSGSK